jgi:hypothetical protein
MTYTFKLARRLAVSRNFRMLPVLLLVAGCTGGDATSPENSPNDVPGSGIYAWRPQESTPVALLVSPSRVIVETNQLLQFRARGRNRAGDEVVAPVTWSTTGGTILPDGRFSAASVGTYQVTGRTRTREGTEMVQTSAINVVRRQSKLKSIEVTPVSATLNPGVTQTFAAIGRLANDDTVPIGVSWSAKGGTIDAGGLYVAGDTAGTFKVIATKNASTLADTATITISAPPSPPPPSDSVPTPPTIPVEPVPPPPDTAPTPPPPAPVLAQVTLLPASTTLAPGTTKQFSAYGRTTVGDSVAVNVVFSATGGTVTAAGLYTAGSSAGSFRVIASAEGLADTSTVTVTQPLGSGSGFSGITFGPYHVPLDSLGRPGFYYSGGTRNGVPLTLLSDLSKVRAVKSRVAISLLRAKTQDATGRLSVATTQAYIATWPDISSYIADGTVVGIIVSDDITWPDAWGGERPPLARVDSIALLVKNRWPNAVTMVRATPTQLVGRTWRWLETGWAQYDGPYRSGPPATYRANQAASAKAQRLGLVLSLNVLNGGCGPVELGACMPEAPGTSILGTFADAASVRRYQMSAAEVLHYGKTFLAEPYNCAFIHWQWSPIWTANRPAEQLAGVQAFDTRPDVQAAMTELSSIARQRPFTSCLQR